MKANLIIHKQDITFDDTALAFYCADNRFYYLAFYLDNKPYKNYDLNFYNKLLKV